MANDSIREHFATHLYRDVKHSIDAAKVLPGEYFFTDKNMMISTVLGSCVSACIRDKSTGIGGMNHFMLPELGGDGGGIESQSMRYGSYAMEVLITDLLKHGARRANLEAKVFGGGAVMAGCETLNVGERNASFVLDYLKEEKIPVVAKDLNGAFPRKVFFFPKTGKVLVQKLGSGANQTLASRERAYLQSIQTKPQEIIVDDDLFN